jgi:hypothetical protein
MKEFEHFLRAVPFPNGAMIAISISAGRYSLGPIYDDHLD